MAFILSVKDTYRQAVEAATGGKNTVMYDDKGNPSIMVCIPKFNLSDVIDGAPNTPHPAFIVDGVVKNEIWISKFQNIVHENRAYSIPGVDPATWMNFDQAKQYCTNKGAGWHLMTNVEWAALALWAKKNGTMPRGNNNYGGDINAPYERGKATLQDGNGVTLHTATGSGPASWSHDGTNEGVFDLNGNVWEWNDGLKIVDGKIYVHQDNDFTTPEDLAQWVNTGAAFDNIGGLVLNSYRTAPEAGLSTEFGALAAAAGYAVPELLKYLAIAPLDASHGTDGLYVYTGGERMALRGGDWVIGVSAGVFALDLSGARSYANSYIGFRSALIL